MKSLVDTALFLKRIELFREARAEDLLRLARLCEPATFRAGEVIFSRGEPPDALYLLEDGWVELRGRGGSAFLPAGSAFGGGLLAGAERAQTAVAATDVSALRLPGEALLELLGANAALTVGLLRALAATLGERLI